MDELRARKCNIFDNQEKNMKTFYLAACALIAFSANLLINSSEASVQHDQYLAKCKCKDNDGNKGKS